MRKILDLILPLAVTTGTDLATLPLDIYLKDIAYILSIIYAGAKLYAHYKDKNTLNDE